MIQFTIELEGLFAKSQSIKIFLFKIDKCYLKLITLRIIINDDGKITLIQEFFEFKKCHKVLYQYDTTNMIACIKDIFRYKKAITTMNRYKNKFKILDIIEILMNLTILGMIPIVSKRRRLNTKNKK